MRYIETDKQGKEIVRYSTNKNYTKKELEEQREQFSKDVDEGKIICLSDLMINHGM